MEDMPVKANRIARYLEILRGFFKKIPADSDSDCHDLIFTPPKTI